VLFPLALLFNRAFQSSAYIANLTTKYPETNSCVKLPASLPRSPLNHQYVSHPPITPSPPTTPYCIKHVSRQNTPFLPSMIPTQSQHSNNTVSEQRSSLLTPWQQSINACRGGGGHLSNSNSSSTQHEQASHISHLTTHIFPTKPLLFVAAFPLQRARVPPSLLLPRKFPAG